MRSDSGTGCYYIMSTTVVKTLSAEKAVHENSGIAEIVVFDAGRESITKCLGWRLYLQQFSF